MKSKQQRLHELLLHKSWTDSELGEVTSMKTIRHLELPPGIGLPAGGVSKLASIQSLQSLTIPGNRVTAQDMAAIARMPALWRLDLGGTPLTPAMLEPLTMAPKLKDVWVDNTGIDDTALETIARIPQLEWLIITNNPVSDAGLRHLCSATTLRTLWLDGTRITDAGLLVLAPLQRLTALSVTGSAATERGQDALFAAQQAVRKASRKKGVVARDEQAIAEATRVLIEFLRAMEAWNVETEKQLRGRSNRALERRRASAKVALFERWCTKRKRVYDDPELLTWSIGNGQEPEATILEADQIDLRRIEITVKQEDDRLLYIVLKQKGEWLIDHCKMWMDGGWSDYSLNLI